MLVVRLPMKLATFWACHMMTQATVSWTLNCVTLDNSSKDSFYLLVSILYKGACQCKDRTGKCIMAGLSLSIPATTWSNCSENDMLQTFKNERTVESCLFNVPMMTNASTLPVVLQGIHILIASRSVCVGS